MILKAHRERQGLSQRELARRAGVAYKTIQLLESGGHDSRWSTLAKLAKVLGLPGPAALSPHSKTAQHPTLAEVADRVREQGEDSWRLWLFEFVDVFRHHPHASMAAQAPSPGINHRILALLASTVESLCAERGLAIPWWCAGIPPLPEPWFIAEVESLKAAALAESPAAFRQRNIFVLENFLSRA